MPPRKSWTPAAVTRGDEDGAGGVVLRRGLPAADAARAARRELHISDSCLVLPQLRIDWASGPPTVCRNCLAERRTRGLLQEWSQRSVLSRSSGSTGTTIGDFIVR